MKELKEVYKILLKEYGKQGWWPVINEKTLLCEYHKEAPRNDEESFEICISSILAQNTNWYPNVVRAMRQLKLGREFTKQEQEVIRQAEIREKLKKQTTDTILTQNTNWQNVEKALNNLKTKNLLSLKKLEAISIKKLATLIKPSGYYNQKAKKIKGFIKFLKSNKQINRENLLSVWGIGPETADSILLYAYGYPIFVIDAYTKRILNRLGFKEETYDDLQKLFMQNLPKNIQIYNEYHALLVRLGKYSCKAKPLCKECPLKSDFCRFNFHKV